MLCPACHTNQFHPGYESCCIDCNKLCLCGCKLQISTIYIITNNMNNSNPEDILLKTIKNNIHNNNAIRMLSNFVNYHCVQYKELVEKYLVLM
jgi:hypothetical protein